MNKMRIILWCILFVPFSSYADFSDDQVADWTAKVIKETLSVSYLESRAEVNAPSKYYSYNGWNNIASFLGDRMVNVREKKIITNPVPAEAPTVVNSGEYSGVRYWRVNQGWVIPELEVEVWFSAVVLQKNSNELMINSMSMHGERLN